MRITRGRLLVCGVITVALLAGITVLWPDHEPPSTSKTTTTPQAPAKGDLAGDQDFLQIAAKALSAGLLGLAPEMLGGDHPHVYWAGQTERGKVAIATQALTGGRTAVGLVVSDTLTDWFVPDQGNGYAFLFSTDSRYIIAVGTDLSVSPEWTVGDDGKSTRQWTPMTDLDDAWFTRLDNPPIPDDLRVITGDPSRATYAQHIPTHYARPVLRETEPEIRTLQSKPGHVNRPRDDTSNSPPISTNLYPDLVAACLVDPVAGSVQVGAQSIAGLPNGGSAVAIEILTNQTDGSRYYVAIRDNSARITRWLVGNPVDITQPLSLHVALPDNLGWLVEAPSGNLRYRDSPNTDWQGAGYDLALLPPTATEVEVLAWDVIRTQELN
ncbi:hypothetical protein [Actinokineospora inagensis]|uniref:hypothetical protein n=1 Tax=Actinokineospora inagensis TaxID=103730 RepID=UPI00047E53BD|nr:hypothetical protein [Actinokineospora inagensis]